MLDNLAYGDMVMTTGGIHGKVTGLADASSRWKSPTSQNKSRQKRRRRHFAEIGSSAPTPTTKA
jgi:preprotein translocase subunit YajC